MRRSLTAEILEHLVTCGASLVLTGLLIPYGQGLGRSMHELDRVAARCPHDFSGHSNGTISVTLSRLRRRGFTSPRRTQKRMIWHITAHGRRHFKNAGIRNTLPPKDGKVRLVVYDIPEDMASHRIWLRNRLLACDYRYFQRSVWLGTRPLPEGLLAELRKRGISRHVHVVGLENQLGRKP